MPASFVSASFEVFFSFFSLTFSSMPAFFVSASFEVFFSFFSLTFKLPASLEVFTSIFSSVIASLAGSFIIFLSSFSFQLSASLEVFVSAFDPFFSSVSAIFEVFSSRSASTRVFLSFFFNLSASFDVFSVGSFTTFFSSLAALYASPELDATSRDLTVCFALVLKHGRVIDMVDFGETRSRFWNWFMNHGSTQNSGL